MTMLNQITRLARHSAIYSISTALQKLPGFLLLPIYTNFNYIPSESHFADFVIILTFIAFMNFFYTYGMDSAMLRYFFLGKRDRKTVFSSTFFILIVTSLLTTAVVMIFSADIARLLLKSAEFAHYIRLAGMVLFFDALGNLPYLILRAEEKSLQFTLYKGLRFILELAFNVLFVVVLRLGVDGILYTFVAVAIVNLLVMTPIIVRYLTRAFDFALAKELLKFGLPFLPHGIAFTTIELVDRFIVPVFLGKGALGVYGANYKFGAILLLLINAFRNAWQPFFLKIAAEENAKQIYARVLTYFVVGGGLIVLGGTLFIRDLLTFQFWGKFHLLAEESYWAGIAIIPIILLSYLFYGIYVILTPGFYIQKQSKYMIVFTGSGAAVNVIANIILLPLLNSFWGAAWATLISYFTMAFTIYLISNRIFPLQIEWIRISKMFILILAIMGLYYGFEPDFWPRFLLMLTALLYCLFYVLQNEERRAARSLLVRLLQHRQK